jgi:hypothetical protein
MNLLVSLAEGARFENHKGIDTRGSDLILSTQSKLLTEELVAGEEPIKHDRTR